VRSARLRRCVTHYNVIGDALKGASLISQYRRRTLQMLVSHHVEKLRRAIRVTHLTLDDCLSYSGTNRRCMFCETRLRLSYAPSEFLQVASWSSAGFNSYIVPAEATSSHSHTKAHMDNTLIHKHIQKHKSI
jgi:hypothetical protein